jgi:signal transduction histidine kinase/ActR/RegA family two-component response regulator
LQQRRSLLLPVRVWRERLSARLVTAVLAMSLVSLVLLSGYYFRASARALEEQLESVGETIVRMIAYTTGDAIVTDDTPAMEEYAAFLLNRPEVAWVRIERADGKVMNPKNAPTMKSTAGMEVRPFDAPVLLQGDDYVLGRCAVGLDLAPFRGMLRERATASLLQTLTVLGVVAAMLTLLLRVWLGRPLHQLDSAVQRIAAGDLDAPVPPAGVGELRRFASALETMRGNLRASHASLEDQNQRLREVDRLKDEFIANTSHEIRTPLSSILGGIELLADADAAERAELLDAVARNGRHLLFVINQVLDFSKLQANSLCIERENVAVRPLLEDLLACMMPKAREKHLALTLRWVDGAPEQVHTDPQRLRQVVMNLLGNAIKFTTTGGIELAAEARTGEEGPVLAMTVTDTGVGIPADVQARLFVPFSQGDASMTRRFGGTGLGLVISRQLARALGGDVTMASEAGVGTRATVTVPVGTVVAAASTPVAPVATASAPAAAGRVLIVDDAPDNRRLLSTMLRKTGVEVSTAENGQLGIESIAAADAGGQPFDLVLMDIQMPVLDGCAAVRLLRSGGCKLPLVALTAHANGRDRTACLEAGFDDYATKPITRSQLAELVRRYVGQPVAR